MSGGWPGALPGPSISTDPAAWLAAREARIPGLRPGVEKAIRWAGSPGQRTQLALVYVHGFSASRQEISPVPERIAQRLGANLFATRLAGHGRDGAALAQASLHDWALDMAEAMAIGRAIGQRIMLIGTSTGGSLASLASLEPAWAGDIAALILISPNFALQNRFAWMLDLPGARHWLPALVGRRKTWPALSPDHARYWTLTYPTRALFTLRAAQRAAAAADHGAARVPMLVFLSDADRVVRAEATRHAAARWGAPVTMQAITGAEDPFQHVITGAIRSPGTTEAVITASLSWLACLPQR